MTPPRMHALALAAILLGAPATAGAVGLQVMIPRVKPEDGKVVVQVYNDPVAWKAGGKPMHVTAAAFRDGVAVVQLQVPPGRYAIAAFQDKNGDGKLGTLAFGWPTELSGYSGVTRPMFGRPDFDKSDFNVSEEQRTTVFVRLK